MRENILHYVIQRLNMIICKTLKAIHFEISSFIAMIKFIKMVFYIAHGGNYDLQP
jgi:hypothetical protein